MKKITVIDPAPPAQLNDDRPVLRVAAYARVSTEEDEQKKSSAFSMGFVLFSHTNNKGTHRVPLLLVMGKKCTFQGLMGKKYTSQIVLNSVVIIPYSLRRFKRKKGLQQQILPAQPVCCKTRFSQPPDRERS